jgi:hypothetical protein
MKTKPPHDAIQAARSPTPGGRHEGGRATQDPYKMGLSAALTLSPGIRGFAGDTEPLQNKAFSRPHQSTVLQTACLLGGSAVGRETCVNHHRKQSTRRAHGAHAVSESA